MSERAAKTLRVVLVHRYYLPDTPPYAAILAAIADAMATRGHDVRVLTCQPSYRRSVVSSAPRRERLGRVSIRRFPVLDDRRSHPAKLVNLVWFCLRLLLSTSTFRGADVVMAATTPPVAVARVCSLLARWHGAQFIYHKQDVWPEVSNGRGLLHRIMRRIDHGTEQAAARVVVLSQDMAETVTARGPATTEVLNNFDPWDVPPPPASAPDAVRSRLRIVFAGNLGRFQGVEELVEVVRLMADEPSVEWHFFGDGPLRPLVEGALGNVIMHGHCAPEEVASFVAEHADLGVVSLKPGVIRSAYPSKTMTYLRNGCPVLVLLESDSELARMVVDERIGVVGSPDTPEAVAGQLRELVRKPESLQGARQRARDTYQQRFGRDRQLARWITLMEEVAR